MTSREKSRRKKESQLVIRLEKDLRDRFVDACQELDTSASREIRRFMKGFLREYDKGEHEDQRR